MYAICSTKKNDVRDAVKEMKAQGRSFPVYQFGESTYKKLERSQEKVRDAIAKKSLKYTIALAGTVHKNGCKKIKGETVQASLYRAKLTGLRMCSCMK